MSPNNPMQSAMPSGLPSLAALLPDVVALAEAAAMSINSGKVRLMIIWNVNFTNYGSGPMAGYAIVRPGGGCPACDALGAIVGSR